MKRNSIISAILFTFTIMLMFVSAARAEERIGVVTNFYPEIKPFLKRLEGHPVQVKKAAGIEFFETSIDGKTIVVFMGGSDEAAASSALQKAIDEFKLTRIIVSGVAGGVSDRVHIGDVVIPAQWANHTFGYLANKKHTYASFFKPMEDFSEPFGFMYHDAKEINMEVKAGDAVGRMVWFPTDRGMLDLSAKLGKLPNLKNLAGNQTEFVIGGNGASGTWFVDNWEYRQHLMKYFNADIVDVESQALCQVALMNNKPIIVIRAVSDFAGNPEDKHNTVRDNLFGAAFNSSEAVWEFIKLIK
ncbi:MAG: 5'-methylthioadenosine/S-adenosylhomocysteine nucleosidase [Firmicutes bacterium]|nr:5'-methylthioadenosine/S-adenosylhomocysteine nucleosidase [Bacillota bacterium]